MKQYIFIRPTRGTETLVVYANTVKEGTDLINKDDPSVICTDHSINYLGKPVLIMMGKEV